MQIGIMLRAYDEQGGIGVYTQNIVRELVTLDQRNHYVLFYRDRANLGRFADYANVTERVVWAPSKVLWDQVAIPYHCWCEGIDLIFHPKFTAPLLAPCPAVMVVHGADWFLPDQAQFYSWFNIYSMRLLMPLYFKKCGAVIAVSQLTADDFHQVFCLPPDKIETVYFAPARHFTRVTDPQQLQAVKTRYNLPDKFILTLTKPKGDGRKNLGQILKAYAHYHAQVAEPHKLVIGGKDCDLYRATYAIPADGYGRDILFPGWLDQADLPAIYSLADLYLYPSKLEAFPIPLTEAMACGTPIVTSDVNGLREIAGDAALLIDPTDTAAIADAIGQVLADHEVRASLAQKGLARSAHFSWDHCAQKTLQLLERVAGYGNAAAAG